VQALAVASAAVRLRSPAQYRPSSCQPGLRVSAAAGRGRSLGVLLPTPRPLAPHSSRGAKLALLAAASIEEQTGARIVGLGLVDPVDETYDAAAAPGCVPLAVNPTADEAKREQLLWGWGARSAERHVLCPHPSCLSAGNPFSASLCLPPPPRSSVSALPALRRLAAAGVPALVVGAGRNADCIPRAANYEAFWEACRGAAGGGGGGGGGGGPCRLAVASGAGHLQFLEAPTTLQR
jgi:hypothetical protein